MTKTIERASLSKTRPRSQQRVVSRLVAQWEDIAKRKDAFAAEAYKKHNDANAFRASGIASAFRYCAARLKWELGG